MMRLAAALAAFVLTACNTVASPDDAWPARTQDFGEFDPGMDEPGHDAVCGPVASGARAGHVYRVLGEASHAAPLCDARPYTLAVRGDGLARPVYGPLGDIPFGSGRGDDFNPDTHTDEALIQAEMVLDQLRRRIVEGIVDPRTGDVVHPPAIACAGEGDARVCHETGPVRVMIFAHGGMVAHAAAVSRAEQLSQAMLADGHHPIFFVWNSDFPNAYVNHLCCVSQRGESSRFRQNFFLPARLFGDVASGIARYPQNALTQGERFQRSVISQDDPLYYLPDADCAAPGEGWTWEADAIARQVCHRAVGDIDLHAFEQGGSASRRPAVEGPGGAVRAGFRSPNLVVFPPFEDAAGLNGGDEPLLQRRFRYVALAPARVVTSLFGPGGESGWHNMVRRARMTVWNASEFSGTPYGGPVTDKTDAGDCERRSRYQGLGGHGVFLERLTCIRSGAGGLIGPPRGKLADPALAARRALAEEPLLHREIEITFVGHSMGAIVANEVLEHYGSRLPLTRVIYMASAASIRDFNRAAAPLAAGAEARDHRRRAFLSESPPPLSFYNLMLHPLGESRELAPGGVASGLLPQGSLLEWIDEYFEGPRNAEERTLGKWSNVWRTWDDMDPELRRRTLFRIFPVQTGPVAGEACADPQERCHPVVHGGFDQFSFWREGYLGGCAAIRARDPEAACVAHAP